MLFHYHRNKWTQTWCLKPRQTLWFCRLQVLPSFCWSEIEVSRPVSLLEALGEDALARLFHPLGGHPPALVQDPFLISHHPWHSHMPGSDTVSQTQLSLTHSCCPHLPHLQIFLMTLGHRIARGTLWHHHIIGVPLSHVRWQSQVVEVNMHLGAMTKKVFSFNSSRTLIVWDLSKSTASSAGLHINQLSLN